jgi:hypothetical protein
MYKKWISIIAAVVCLAGGSAIADESALQLGTERVTTIEFSQQSWSSATRVDYQKWRPAEQYADGTVAPGQTLTVQQERQDAGQSGWFQRTDAYFPFTW